MYIVHVEIVFEIFFCLVIGFNFYYIFCNKQIVSLYKQHILEVEYRPLYLVFL